MMTKRNSKFADAKKYLAIPLFIVLAGFFAEKVYANDSSPKNTSNNESFFSEEPYIEFKQILSKYSRLLDNKEYAEFENTISKRDLERLTELYPKLSLQQQEEQPLIFLDFSNYSKLVPTEKQLNDFSTDQKYFIFIDQKETRNSELKKYKSSDFSHVSINTDGNESFVTLMTNDYFKKHVEEKKLVMGFISAEISPPLSRKKSVNDTIKPRKTVETELIEAKSSDSNVKKVQNLPIPPSSSANFIQAEFPGEANILRNKVSGVFDGSVFKGDEGTLKTTVYIGIDEQGTVDKITTSGDNEKFNFEAERAVKVALANEKWKPATNEGNLKNNVQYAFNNVIYKLTKTQ